MILFCILELTGNSTGNSAGNTAGNNKQTRIIPRHLQLSIRSDEELSKLLSGVCVYCPTSRLFFYLKRFRKSLRTFIDRLKERE